MSSLNESLPKDPWFCVTFILWSWKSWLSLVWSFWNDSGSTFLPSHGTILCVRMLLHTCFLLRRTRWLSVRFVVTVGLRFGQVVIYLESNPTEVDDAVCKKWLQWSPTFVDHVFLSIKRACSLLWWEGVFTSCVLRLLWESDISERLSNRTGVEVLRYHLRVILMTLNKVLETLCVFLAHSMMESLDMAQLFSKKPSLSSCGPMNTSLPHSAWFSWVTPLFFCYYGKCLSG